MTMKLLKSYEHTLTLFKLFIVFLVASVANFIVSWTDDREAFYIVGWIFYGLSIISFTLFVINVKIINREYEKRKQRQIDRK